jgi:hypothetical protein
LVVGRLDFLAAPATVRIVLCGLAVRCGRLTVDGQSIDLLMVGDYALVTRDVLPGKVVLSYALPVSTQVERTDGVDYAITWRGDEVIGISPNSDFLPFYPTYTADANETVNLSTWQNLGWMDDGQVLGEF